LSARKKDFNKNGSMQSSQYRSTSKYQNESDEEQNTYRRNGTKINERKTLRKNFSDDDDDDDDEENFRKNRFDKNKSYYRNKISENPNLNASTLSSTNASKSNLKSDTNDKNKEKEKEKEKVNIFIKIK
jgi:hypothetical protein